MTLPIDSENQRTGRIAASILSVWLQRNNIIVRHEEQSTDFGIDMELELHDAQFASGLLVKCQVKGTKGPAFPDGDTTSVGIKSSTRNYWATLPLNVMCVLVDISDSTIYWTPAPATLSDTTNTSVQFSRSMRADLSPDTFTNALLRLAETPTSSRVLSLVPAGIQLFSKLWELSESVYDHGFETEPDIDGSIRVFYEHLERLCIFTGVQNLPARWLLWERRNAVIQSILDSNDSGLLDGNLVGEIVRYSAPFYKEALRRVKRCVDAENLIESDPAFAGTLMAGTLDTEVVDAAFARLESQEAFHLDSDTNYSFQTNARREDVEFDCELAIRNVHYYSVRNAI